MAARRSIFLKIYLRHGDDFKTCCLQFNFSFHFTFCSNFGFLNYVFLRNFLFFLIRQEVIQPCRTRQNRRGGKEKQFHLRVEVFHQPTRWPQKPQKPQVTVEPFRLQPAEFLHVKTKVKLCPEGSLNHQIVSFHFYR